MCCFSGNVRFVSSTRIFARRIAPDRQAVVYQMRFGADEDLAMILPLPVKTGSGEDALEFVNLEGYAGFFNDLAKGFPAPPSRAEGDLVPLAANGLPLKVETVGAFDASYVPTVKDFPRLDARFRLAEGVWDKLPQYADHGFAVFKLRKGDHEAHPMAFSFPSRNPESLFFPTVHIHDGQVHPEEEFDHVLFCQVAGAGGRALLAWEESERPAKNFTQPDKSKGMISPDRHIHRQRISGKRKNEDVILGAA